jgi:protein ImuA
MFIIFYLLNRYLIGIIFCAVKRGASSMQEASLVQLRAQISSLEQGPFERRERLVSSSIPEIDAWLPRAGFVLGSFVELLQDTAGAAAYSIALKWSRHAAALKPAWAVVDTEATFNPVVADAYGWDPQKLILVRAAHQEAGWCFAQLLRSKDIGACFWASNSMDNMVFRRLQLAAERGGGLGFVIRPISALRKPCWGSLRIQVTACGSKKVRLRVLHARAQPDAAQREIQVDV